jgi:hypothetical protein
MSASQSKNTPKTVNPISMGSQLQKDQLEKAINDKTWLHDTNCWYCEKEFMTPEQQHEVKFFGTLAGQDLTTTPNLWCCSECKKKAFTLVSEQGS